MFNQRHSNFEMRCVEQTIADELELTFADDADLRAQIVALASGGGLAPEAPAVLALDGLQRRGVRDRKQNLLGAVEIWREALAERGL